MLPRYETALAAGDTSVAHAAHVELSQLIKAAGKISSSPRAHGSRRWMGAWPNSSAGKSGRTSAAAARCATKSKRWLRRVCIPMPSRPACMTRVPSGNGSMPSKAATSRAAASGLARRFHGVCQHALKPAQAYFEKRDSVRDAHRNELEALLTRVAAMPADTTDWKALSVLQRELSGALRSLDGVNPRDRNHCARRIKDAIASISARIEEHAKGIATAKARLIEQAEALSQNADRGAARAARELQQQWTALGEGLRSADQKQWRQFRAACDRIFATLDAGRKEREASATAQAGQAQAIVDEAEALANDTGDRRRSARRSGVAIWTHAGVPSAPATASLTSAGARLSRSCRHAAPSARGRSGWHAIRLRCRNSPCCANWNAERNRPSCSRRDGKRMPHWSQSSRRRLTERWMRACQGELASEMDDAVEAARDLLVRLEFIAGIASPEEDRQRRMDFQVARLSARMRGGAALAPERELDEVLSAWFAQPPQPLETRAALRGRRRRLRPIFCLSRQPAPAACVRAPRAAGASSPGSCRRAASRSSAAPAG